MQPLVPYLLGESHPAGARLTDSQKSFRAGDIEEIGDNRHSTFFEMLGNWSLGDYFKREQLPWLFEFLTSQEQGVGLDPAHLYVTVFAGDEAAGIPRDSEAVQIWQRLFKEKGIEANDIELLTEERGAELGMQSGRIFYYDAKKNWWSRAGNPEKMPTGEPGGPDSEVFYEFTDIPHDEAFGKHCHPNCDCGRFLEIGNSVFMEYIKQADGSFAKLPKRNVDFGGGLERLAMVAQNSNDMFEVNHKAIIKRLEAASGKRYGDSKQELRAFRVIADHIKAAAFLMADGVRPGNVERGYIVRRLLRRAIRFCDTLGVGEGVIVVAAEEVINDYATAYPSLVENKEIIFDEIAREETKFRNTLQKGMKEFEKIAEKGLISGTDAFLLFSSYGFPIELTSELAGERKITVDSDGFNAEMAKHREGSRAGSAQKFAGGLADTAEKTVRLHTAHHLLLRALQIVLGEDVKQRGSNITQERLRIDFSYPSKMSPEQIAEVERIVNEKINEDLPVIRSEMSRDDAEKLGAEHEFGQKYPERVSVYSVGPKGATAEDPKFDQRYSIEFCGGPHVTHTGELGMEGRHFKIQKEEAVSQGVRRIRAILE
jgi:alanyl-tRNA synthetase